MTQTATVNAGLVIIGDEILSGRTKDENLNFLAVGLAEIGINLREVRVVADEESEIIFAVNEIKTKYNYIFTSGGVGPTHDDITSATIAKAFGDTLIQNAEAVAILTKHYGEGNVNEARLKMAYVPSRAKLLDNPLSSAPGFRIENVFVMAGVPKIFQAMFLAAKKELVGGNKIRSQEVRISITESVIAKDFALLQKKYPQVVMGSYPSEDATSLVFRSTNYEILEQSVKEMTEILERIKAVSIITVVKSN